MYIVIGGDGKEYGPIPSDDLRQWISEGRLNAQSLAKAESDAEFRPLSTFPELADTFVSRATPVATTDWKTRDYELDIGGCVSRGWDLFKENLGTLWGGFLIGMLIIMAAGGMLGGITALLIPKTWMFQVAFRITYNFVMQAVLSLVNGPLLGGIFYIFIQRMRGRSAGLGEIFIGFQKSFSQLVLGNLVVGFLTGLCLIPFHIVYLSKLGPILEQLQHATPTDMQQTMSQFWQALFGTLPVLGVCLIPMTYLALNWQFALPLIIDRQMHFWDAMKMSWKKVHFHWWHVFGFVVIIGLINLGGLLVCCVGLIFTAPLTVAATMYAYETIFGESQNH
jgi:hypothetical protein